MVEKPPYAKAYLFPYIVEYQPDSDPEVFRERAVIVRHRTRLLVTDLIKLSDIRTSCTIFDTGAYIRDIAVSGLRQSGPGFVLTDGRSEASQGGRR